MQVISRYFGNLTIDFVVPAAPRRRGQPDGGSKRSGQGKDPSMDGFED